MYNCTQTITVKVTGKEWAEELCDYLAKEYPTGEWDYIPFENRYEIFCNEAGEAKYYRGRYFGKPEDCCEDDYDLNFEIYEGDVENSIQKFVTEKDIELDWYVTSDLEMWDYD